MICLCVTCGFWGYLYLIGNRLVCIRVRVYVCVVLYIECGYFLSVSCDTGIE